MNESRPYVILNSAMSLDGKIATKSRESRLSSQQDLQRVHRLRSRVDGIMVGLGTILSDNPKLTIKYYPGRNPTRIIVDGLARTPADAYVVKTARKVPTIIAVTSKASAGNIHRLKKLGVTVLVCGRGRLVSLSILMKRVMRLGIRKILLEGGGTLNWSMLSQGFVDEVSVAVSPLIIGGREAVTLVEGEGVERVEDAVKLRFTNARSYGADIVLSYEVLD